MSNITIGQMIMDAQRMASRVKDLDALGSALLVEAEGNNRHLESMRQFQDDIDSLNRITRDKSNADMVNRINQQNPSVFEIRKENRELKACLEDHQRALELIMHKYREHTNSKVLESKINFKEMYNEHLWKIIREQAEKINEMAAVMQKAASLDDDNVYKEIELLSKLRMENKNLRELLQISNQFDSAGRQILFNAHLLQDKGIQTDDNDDMSEKDSNSSTVEVLSKKSTDVTNHIMNCTFDIAENNNTTLQVTDNAAILSSSKNERNNNGPTTIEAAIILDSNASSIDCSQKNLKDEKNSMRITNGCKIEEEILIEDSSGTNASCDDSVSSPSSPLPSPSSPTPASTVGNEQSSPPSPPHPPSPALTAATNPSAAYETELT